MTVSKSSWHYRLYQFAWKSGTPPPDPKTLCGYFWALVASPLGIYGRAIIWLASPVARAFRAIGRTATTIVLSAAAGSALTAWAFLDWKTEAIATGIAAGGCAGLVAIVGARARC